MNDASSSVIGRVSSSMSAVSLNHQLIASNIANRDTAGYERLKLSFDRAMDGASTRSSRIEREPAGGPPSIEQDLVDLSANTERYQALARVLSRYFQIANVVTGGARS
jgi:flagellar basal-body rod protein FlgB